MSTQTLEQVKNLIDELGPLEQARLLEYLTPKIARALASAEQEITPAERGAATPWQELFRIGDEIAATEQIGTQTMTQAVIAMRR